MTSTRKDPLTIYVEHRTWTLIEEHLDLGNTIDMMRDFWYEMKDDDIILDSKCDMNEEDYQDKVAKIIYKTFAKYAEKDTSVYTRLGLHSKMLVKGKVPIVVIFEKKKSVAIPLVEEYHAGYAFARGQFPTFESVHVANYFEECGYGVGYVFIVSDYDPSGENLYSQVKTKMDKFTHTIDIKTTWVKFGDDPIGEFDSYELKNNPTNSKWIKEGRDRGVEFNTPTNISKGILRHLTQSIVDNVDPRHFVLHSYKEWVAKEQRELQKGDEAYQEWSNEAYKLHTRMSNRRTEHAAAVAMIQTNYVYDRGYDRILYLTEPRGDWFKMKFEDIEYYDFLLGSSSPYTLDIK